MQNPAHVGLLLALIAWSAGCEAPPVAITPTVADSAGVRLLTYDLTDAEIPEFAQVTDHDLEIGSVAGEDAYLLSRVADIATPPDGSILVSTDGALSLFGSDGTHVRTLGLEGDGPGEFASPPTVAGIAGDTIFAWDGRNRRVTSFLRSGQLVGTTRVGAEALGPIAVRRYTDGTHLVQSRWLSADPNVPEAHDARIEVDSIVVEHVDAAGGLLDTLGVFTDRERVKIRQVLPDGRFGLQMTSRPLTSQAFARAHATETVIAHNASFDATTFDNSGRPSSILRVVGAWPAPSAAEISDRLVAQLEEASQNGEIHPLTRRLYDEFSPDHAPTFSTILIASTGDRWFASYELHGSQRAEWLVFSGDGELRGKVLAPPGVRIYEIGPVHILGVFRDEFDVPYVRRYRLE